MAPPREEPVVMEMTAESAELSKMDTYSMVERSQAMMIIFLLLKVDTVYILELILNYLNQLETI